METNGIAEKVIGCAYKVSNSLGVGFLEKVYENALVHEIKKAGLKVKQQHAIDFKYDDVLVGEYIADLLVEDELLVELKSAETFDKVHFAQCLNYLKATGLKVCLLINFGKTKVQVRRFVNHF
jgi:GxxExxY protein